MIARFNLPLRHHQWAGWAVVIVYDTVAQLRVAAHRYTPDLDVTDIEAIWQTQVCSAPPCTLDHRFLGVMRFTRVTDAAQVVHECTHAAMTAWRRHRGRTIVIEGPPDDHLNPVDHWDQPEELLAYAISDLAATCLARLRSLSDRGVVVEP